MISRSIEKDTGLGAFEIAFPAPKIDLGRMLRAHGYKQPESAPKKVMAEALKARAQAMRLARPQSFHRMLQVENLRRGKLALENGVTFTCPAFDQHLRGCSQVCVFIATLGDALDKGIDASFSEDDFQPLQALFLGTCGWLMIEAVTRDLMRHLKSEQAKSRKGLTLRMGPGYRYRIPGASEKVSWDMAEQKTLHSIFLGSGLPVKITEGLSMKPTMSRSGLAGIRDFDNQRPFLGAMVKTQKEEK